MAWHVFVVDKNTFTVHSKFQFCGVVNPVALKERYGVYADLMNLRPGDNVVFYQRFSQDEPAQNGFNGLYTVKDKPFFDGGDVVDPITQKTVHGKCTFCGSTSSPKRDNQFSPAKCLNCHHVIDYPILPNRVLIQTNKYFANPIQDNEAYVDHTDHGILWTMLFRKTSGAGRARSVMHILPEEGMKLERLFNRANPGSTARLTIGNYAPRQNYINLNLQQHANPNGSFVAESVLHAWIMQNIDKNPPVLGPTVVGPIRELEYFGAWVPYNLGTNTVDILLLHKRDDKRFKATIIELKKGKINNSAITQVMDYVPWISQLAIENAEPEINTLEIQPVAIGFGQTSTVNLPNQRTMTSKYFSTSLSGSRNMKTITVNKPKILHYKFNSTTNTVDFI